MLRFLRIRNLAVIESVEVEFEPGFNVLTGETGAGKSIVVEAVGLLLGARASSDLVRTGETQATIEAIFEATAGAGRSSMAPWPRRLRCVTSRNSLSNCMGSTSITHCSTPRRTFR
jgi:DNA repair ATPase RecN